MNQESGVTAVVYDLIRTGAVGPGESAECAVPVFFQRFAFPCEYGNTVFCDCGCRLILCGEDVAGTPADVGAEFNKGFDQHGGLDGHVQTAHDLDAFERFLFAVFFADRHQAGHFFFCNVELFASGFGEGDVTDFVIVYRSFRNNGFRSCSFGCRSLFVRGFFDCRFCGCLFHNRFHRGILLFRFDCRSFDGDCFFGDGFFRRRFCCNCFLCHLCCPVDYFVSWKISFLNRVLTDSQRYGGIDAPIT